jgi:hypothetical protein
MWSALPIFRIAAEEHKGALRHSARSRLDNCSSDLAVRNPRQVTDLLSGQDMSVVTLDE